MVITPEKKYEGDINNLLIIVRFGDYFLIGRDLHINFYVRIDMKGGK